MRPTPLISAGSPTGGTFQLKFNGSSTATINYSTNPGTLQANIQNALDALSTIGAGNTQVLVNAGATSATITFQNADAATPETPITATVVAHFPPGQHLGDAFHHHWLCRPERRCHQQPNI